MEHVAGRAAIAARAEAMLRTGEVGRAFDEATRLEVSRAPAGYRVACLVADEGATPEGVPQVIAVLPTREATLQLVEFILAEADAQIEQVRDMAAEGEIPATVGSFSELHDHTDANMLGFGGNDSAFRPHRWVGVGAPDVDEAWCGVFNCAHNAVDRMIRYGGLHNNAPAAPAV